MTMLGEQKRLIEILEDEKKEGQIDMCKAIDDLIEDGRILGEIEGEQKAEKRLTNLIQILLKNNRQDLLLKASQDDTFRKQLYTEYHLV